MKIRSGVVARAVSLPEPSTSFQLISRSVTVTPAWTTSVDSTTSGLVVTSASNDTPSAAPTRVWPDALSGSVTLSRRFVFILIAAGSERSAV